MSKKHECHGCKWLNLTMFDTKWMIEDYACEHPRWTEINALVYASDVMDNCRCPLGRQRRCQKCGRMMKFHPNRPKYHGGEWRCNCGD